MRTDHLNWDTILEAIESPHAIDSETSVHLRDCPRCIRLAREAEWILGLLADARLPQPPQALQDATLAQIRTELSGAAVDAPARTGLRATARQMAERIIEIWATPVADSLQPSIALRGAQVASPRMMAYETDTLSVTLSIAGREAESGGEILGQVTPKAGAVLQPGGRAATVCGDRMIEAPLSEFGEFSLQGLTREVEELTILLGDTRIRLRLPPV